MYMQPPFFKYLCNYQKSFTGFLALNGQSADAPTAVENVSIPAVAR